MPSSVRQIQRNVHIIFNVYILSPVFVSLVMVRYEPKHVGDTVTSDNIVFVT